MAANRLTQRSDVAATLVNPRAAFVAYRDVLAERVRLVVACATRIDAAGRAVALDTGDTVHYDHLVYAVGSGTPEPRGPDRPGDGRGAGRGRRRVGSG
ncbi:hypothetical protein GCM10023148_33440 [Actinokineospora soli]